jgi:hypothetical protein
MFFDDPYKAEYEQFQWDVHMLIEGTLDASIRFLDTESKTELAKIEQWLKTPESIKNEYRDHWVDEHTHLLVTNDGQVVFLTNMALVALASRLTHSLKKMARSAETFSPRVKEDDKFENEFVVLSGYSGACQSHIPRSNRSSVPRQTDHAFRGMPISRSEVKPIRNLWLSE